MALGFHVDCEGRGGGVRLQCEGRGRWHQAFMWREGKVTLGFHVEGGAGGTRLSFGERGRWC